jgi:hypothetical protein
MLRSNPNYFAPLGMCGSLAFALCWLATIAPQGLNAGNPRPVSVQDLCLMLRSGYTDGEVLQETASRPLLEPLTPASEQALRTAGADQRLIDALKTNRQVATPAEAMAARAQQAAEAQRASAVAAEQTAVPAQAPAQRPVTSPATAPAANAPSAPQASAADPQYIAKMLRGKLVVFRDEQLAPAENDALKDKTMIGLYYARLTTKGTGTFPTDLVQIYRTAVVKHPEFEIVFISGDPSLYSMENYVRHLQMPWPALAFDQISQVPALSHLQDPTGAARLVVADNYGRIHAAYHIGPDNPNLPRVILDLAKVIADPNHFSVLAPPPGVPPGGAVPRA